MVRVLPLSFHDVDLFPNHLIDPFNVNEDSYSAFFFRYYLTRCFDESWAPSLTKLINDVYKFDVVDGSLKSYMTPIEQVLKAIKNDLEGRPCEKWRMKLLFQALFNVAYPRYKEDKNAVLHAIGTVIIEHVCHCLEYPVHMGIEIVDGVRVRPNVALIVNMLRNYAYSQNVYPTAKDKDLHELWLSNSAIVDFMKWLGSMVQVGFAKKEICIAVNESIDIFYENFFAPGIVREIDFVAKHFVSKQDLIKPNMTSDNDKDIVSFLTKNADYCAKVAGMKFES